MNYNKIFEKFIKKVCERGCYASKEEVENVTFKMLDIINNNLDATPEELVEKIILDDICEMENLRNQYLIPGYTIGINVGNINVEYFGGTIDSLERRMPEDAMFDIASMTKMYTQVILYNLIKEGRFSLDDKVTTLDPRFVNLSDVSMRELSEFTIEFQTPGNITTMENIEDAKEALYNIDIAYYPDGNLKRGKYFYSDFGMMIIKEVVEKVTGKTYADLVDEYIISRLGLSSTKLIVPKKDISRLTGSPNSWKGLVNDPKSMAVGGFSGHAGIFASNDDLIKFGKGIITGTIFPKDELNKAYTAGIRNNRGKLGNTYVATPDGITSSYVAKIAPTSDFVIQGSTRTQLNMGKNSISTILLNPASISLEKAKEEENRINEERLLEGKLPISLVRHFEFNRNGLLQEYYSVDARQILNCKQVDPLTIMNAKTALRLEFLQEVINEYDKNYTKEVNVVVDRSKQRVITL